MFYFLHYVIRDRYIHTYLKSEEPIPLVPYEVLEENIHYRF